jgi:uncharacterized protein (DUF1697 family)
MPRYAALLRGVSPMNLKMPELKAAFEAAGFEDVKTLLSSGNVLFTAPALSQAALEVKCEAALMKRIGKSFPTIVRRVSALRELLESDPYRAFQLAPGSKRVVTFLRTPAKSKIALPIELHGARILTVVGTEVLSAYVRTPKGPVFMTLIEKTFGKEVTTRTWETVQKLAR